jgi:hypothetical protein
MKFIRLPLILFLMFTPLTAALAWIHGRNPATVPAVVLSIATSGTGITNGNGGLGLGAVVTLTANMSKPVTITGGPPTLTLNDGGTASYTSGSGTANLVFTYTVPAGQKTGDLTVTTFNVNGAGIVDGNGNTANMAGANNYDPIGTLQIDATPPPPPVTGCSSTGTKYFVAASGNDSNAGTSTGAAWKTINKVNAGHYHAGDCINFNGGDNFSGNLDLDIGGALNNVLDSDGANPIVIQSYGSGNATITSATGGLTSAILIRDVPGVNVQNLIVRGTGTTTQYGIQYYGLASGVIRSNDVGGFKYSGNADASAEIYDQGATTYILNNTVHGIDGVNSIDDHGIHVGWVQGNVLVQGNTVYNIGGRTGAAGALNGYSGNGINFAGEWHCTSCTHIIERNLVHDVGANTTTCGGPVGIMAYNVNSFITIRFNEIYNIRPTNYTAGVGCDWDGIDLDGGVTNALVEYNYTHDNFGPGLLAWTGDNGSGWGPNIYRYNISQNDYSGGYGSGYFGSMTFVGKTAAVTYFYNNTILLTANNGSDKVAVSWADNSNPAAGSTFENNLIVTGTGVIALKCNGRDPRGTTTFKNNAYYSTSGTFTVGNNCASQPANLAAWQASVLGGDNGANTSNPSFNGTVPVPTGCTWTPSDTTSPGPCLINYQLTTGSPDLGTGLSISSPGTMDFFGLTIPNGVGSGYNIGAYGGVGR